MNEPLATEACPQCGAKGKKVKGITIESQLTDGAEAALEGFEGFRFCATADCPVAYYRAEDQAVIEKTSTQFPIFQKEDSPERLVCYCFNHSVQEIQDEVARTGESAIPAQIRESCNSGLDDCARNNPQGSCCLGNVARVVKAAKGAPVAAMVTEACDCCEDDEVASTTVGVASCCDEPSDSKSGDANAGVKLKGNNGSKLAVSGALLAAMASSACCWLPLLLIGFGLSSFGVAGFFEAYRVLFLSVSTVLLGVAFYLVYFHQPKCAEGEACAVPNRKMQRFSKLMLWVAAFMIGSFAVFPNALELWANNRANAQYSASGDVLGFTEVAFGIEGMTCEACAIGLESAVAKLPGVERAMVDFGNAHASVYVTGDEKAASSKILDVIKASGFEGKTLTKEKTRLAIEGMTCTACAVSAQTSLSQVPGVISAQVDYETKSAEIAADSSVSKEALLKAVEKLGYQARIDGE